MYEPLFHRRPGSPDEWWDTLRSFVHGWYGPLPATDGGLPLAVAIEREVGITTDWLRSWTSFGVDLQKADLFGTALRDTFEVGWRAEFGSVTLLKQVEGDVIWAVQGDDLDQPDPPVVRFGRTADEQGTPEASWASPVVVSECVTAFVLEHLLVYLRPGVRGGGFRTWLDDPDRVLTELGHLLETDMEVGSLRVLEGRDLVVLVHLSRSDKLEAHEISVEMGGSWHDRVPDPVMQLGRRCSARHGFFVDHPYVHVRFDPSS
jgi:hypothetical protein